MDRLGLWRSVALIGATASTLSGAIGCRNSRKPTPECNRLIGDITYDASVPNSKPYSSTPRTDPANGARGNIGETNGRETNDAESDDSSGGLLRDFGNELITGAAESLVNAVLGRDDEPTHVKRSYPDTAAGRADKAFDRWLDERDRELRKD